MTYRLEVQPWGIPDKAIYVVPELTNKALQGSRTYRGLTFGLMRFVLFTIANQYAVFTSMSYPLGFFVANIMTGVVSFPVLGILFAAR